MYSCICGPKLLASSVCLLSLRPDVYDFLAYCFTVLLRCLVHRLAFIVFENIQSQLFAFFKLFLTIFFLWDLCLCMCVYFSLFSSVASSTDFHSSMSALRWHSTAANKQLTRKLFFNYFWKTFTQISSIDLRISFWRFHFHSIMSNFYSEMREVHSKLSKNH